MVCIEHAVRYEVPHLGVAILEILLHSKDGLTRLVMPVSHPLELREGFRDGTVTMGTRTALATIITSAHLVNLVSCRTSGRGLQV